MSVLTFLHQSAHRISPWPLLLALACKPAAIPEPVVPVTVPPVPVEVPAPPAPFMVPPPSRAPAQLEVRTLIVSADDARRDSTNTVAIAAFVRDARGLNVRITQNDSAGRLDSLPPIAVDSSGRWDSARLVLPCRDLGLLPSPLTVRLTQPRSARSWPVQDSVSYTLCSRGAPRTITAVIVWQHPVPAPDRSAYEQAVGITATIAGDSTRAFPMRTSGMLRGEAQLTVTGSDGRLLSSRGTLTVDLTAEANALRQRATQVVSFVITPQP